MKRQRPISFVIKTISGTELNNALSKILQIEIKTDIEE